MSNESERNPCRCPVCVAVPELAHAAGCVALGAEAPARAPETAAEYIVRTFSEALARDTARRLRAISYARAEASPAAIHCASADRRDDNEDALRESDEERAARRAANEVDADWDSNPYNPDNHTAEETVFPALDRLEEDTDAGPARAD